MKIYSMTATFGKLERQRLTLRPGLNIIEAPNEWGKSTWSAFLLAMLYGIDTREKTTKTSLADKERYAPWSGAPMEGSMEICWNGRNITIERRTKGRLIFGDFRAYETESGLDVPELTATNCGAMLLGVERSVFTRAGFLKMSDLPVTQDDALRRRLNSLVTTGDEDNAGELLAQKLKELKNKCRYNKSGLLPQAEAQRDQLEEQLRGLQDLDLQAQRLQQRQRELDEHIRLLQNHKAALAYAEAQEELQHISDAEKARDALQEQLEKLEAECADLPSAEEAERAKGNLQRLHQGSLSLQMEQQLLPVAPEKPQIPVRYEGMDGNAAQEAARNDSALLNALDIQRKAGKKQNKIGTVMLCMIILAAGALLPVPPVAQLAMVAVGAVVGIIGLILLCMGNAKAKASNGQMQKLLAKYAPIEPSGWEADAVKFAAELDAYAKAQREYDEATKALDAQRQILVEQIQALTNGKPLAECMESWENVAQRHRDLGNARRDLQRAEEQLAALRSMTRQVSAPEFADSLTLTDSETNAQLQSAAFEQKQNQLRLGQCQGQAEALGQESALRSQLKQVKNRIEQLEDTYFALELSQKALSAATGELQRRFAPRISKRAQELFGALTGGRYQKLILTEELTLDTAAGDEGTLRSAQWRSDGTVDQLYLALRLAVAEELTPEAPLVLDDAMVRFDDNRLAVALDILKEFAQNKQVILFTCQSREKKLQGE